MIDKFLKAKHWQLFLLFYGIPIALEIIVMVSMFSNLAMQVSPDPAYILNFWKFFPPFMILFLALYFGWFWSVGVGLQGKLPENVKMPIARFKVFLFIPIVYILVFLILMSTIINILITPEHQINPEYFFGFFAVIFPLHLFSIFCIFYLLYFVAKTIKTVELQREVTFSDFAAEFFLIWFFPIGVWFIQPRINKLVN